MLFLFEPIWELTLRTGIEQATQGTVDGCDAILPIGYYGRLDTQSDRCGLAFVARDADKRPI
jgi:hypothetical protein